MAVDWRGAGAPAVAHRPLRRRPAHQRLRAQIGARVRRVRLPMAVPGFEQKPHQAVVLDEQLWQSRKGPPALPAAEGSAGTIGLNITFSVALNEDGIGPG